MGRLRLFLVNVGYATRVNPQVSPPLGALSLAAYLRTKFDLEIRVLNQRLDGCSEQEVARQAIAFEADVVGLGALTFGVHLLAPITQAIRKAHPQTLILLGGPCITADGASVLAKTDADAAVRGEGELAFEWILREWFQGDRNLENIPGLFWRKPDGEIQCNTGLVPLIEDLDSLPLPAFDLVDIRPYWKRIAHTNVPNRKYIALSSSRGCPFGCIFCQHHFGRRFRARSPESIVDEIEQHIKSYGITAVEFLDDAFNVDARRVLEFSQEIVRRNLKIKISFPNGVRGDIFTEDVIDALKMAGMDQCTLAIETGSERLQKLTGKNLNLPRLLENLRYLSEQRIYTHGFAIIGFPTETQSEMEQTIQVFADSLFHSASFFMAIPLPGTEMYEMARRLCPEKLEGLDFKDLNFINACVNLSDVPTEDVFKLQRKANRVFYMNPSRLWRLLRDHPDPSMLLKYALGILRRSV